MTTVGWILNLDADLELADPTGHAPSARLVQQTNALADRLLQSANAASLNVRHVRLAPDSQPDICQAWCATPRARAAAQAMGHVLPPAPSLEVIQRVNHRAFAADLRLDLRDAAFATSTQQLDEVLQSANPAHGWLLKRPFGFSGRSQKRVVGALTDRDRRWVAASMVEYGRGLMVEPFVAIEQEFSLHSWLRRDGECLTGQPTQLVTDDAGAWLRNQPRPDLHVEEQEQLHAAHTAVAKALTTVGYFGPFATDAFRYRDDNNRRRFQPLSECNARYSMGFFTGLANHMAEWTQRIQ